MSFTKNEINVEEEILSELNQKNDEDELWKKLYEEVDSDDEIFFDNENASGSDEAETDNASGSDEAETDAEVEEEIDNPSFKIINFLLNHPEYSIDIFDDNYIKEDIRKNQEMLARIVSTKRTSLKTNAIPSDLRGFLLADFYNEQEQKQRKGPISSTFLNSVFQYPHPFVNNLGKSFTPMLEGKREEIKSIDDEYTKLIEDFLKPKSLPVNKINFINSVEKQEECARNIYLQFASLVIKRIEGYQKKSKIRKEKHEPFIKSIQHYNGVFCTVIPSADAALMKTYLEAALRNIPAMSPACDTLKESITRFFNNYKAFFPTAYTEKGYSAKRSNKENQFSFKLNSHHPFAREIESYINLLSAENRSQVEKASKIASEVSDSVVSSMLYLHAQCLKKITHSSVPVESDTVNYEFCFQLQLPTGLKRKVEADVGKIAKSDTIVRILLIQFDKNHRVSGLFEVSKLILDTAMHKIAAQKLLELSPKILDMIATQEFDSGSSLVHPFLILSRDQATEFVELVKRNNRELYQSILLLPAVEAHRKRSCTRSSSSTNDVSSIKRKAEDPKEDEVKRFQPFSPKKKAKKMHDEEEARRSLVQFNNNTDDESGKTFESATDYLNSLLAKNIKAINDLFKSKIIRSSVDGFNFSKIVDFTLPELGDTKTFEIYKFLSPFKIYKYQLEGVFRLIRARLGDIGTGLFDDMGLGKTVQVCAFLKYVITHENPLKPFLIVTPLSVLEKWEKDELIGRFKFKLEDVVVYHGNRKVLPNNINQSNTIVLTTYETLMSELRSSKSYEFKKLSGMIFKELFADVSQKQINRWSNIVKRLQDLVEPNIVNTGRSKNIRRLPTKDEVKILLKESGIKKEDVLKKLFSSDIIFNYLVKAEYLNKDGFIQKKIDSIQALDELYQEHPELAISKETVVEKFNEAFEQFAWAGIILDEGHHGASDPKGVRYRYLIALAKLAKAHKRDRIIVSGTPDPNKIMELWTEHQFLNPDALLTQDEFMAAFNALISSPINLISQAIDLVSDSPDEYVNVIEEALKAVNDSYDQFQKLADILQKRQIRRNKNDETIRNDVLKTVKENSKSAGKFLPKRKFINFRWELSKEQTEEFAKEDQKAIENACRGYGFLSNTVADVSEDQTNAVVSDAPENQTQDQSSEEKRNKGGIELLSHLSKMFDHPVLVDATYKQRLFDKKYDTNSFTQLIDEIIKEKYQGSVNAFIEASGKLSKLMKRVAEILKEKNTKILISTEFVPMAKIIQFLIKKRHKVEPLLYSGSSDKKERRSIMEKFNNENKLSEYRVHSVVILTERAGAEGIDLYASHVIPYNRRWVSSEQFFCRAQRFGSPYPVVTIIQLLGNNPVDEKMNDFVEQKKDWSLRFVDNDKNYCTRIWFLNVLKKLSLTSYVFHLDGVNKEHLDQVISTLSERLEPSQEVHAVPLQPMEVEDSTSLGQHRSSFFSHSSTTAVVQNTILHQDTMVIEYN